MTTTLLSDIVDLADMEREIEAGYLNRRFHPDFPELATVGYSDKAQFDRHWTDTTRALRGIIYNTRTMEVLARPFSKFGNWGDEQFTEGLDPDARVTVYDKLDGSLGIVYVRPDGIVAVATRGSFESDQAVHATEVLHSKYPDFVPEPGETYLVEIIY